MGSVVQIHPDPPKNQNLRKTEVGTDVGAIAQLGERLLCKQEVTGSIPVGSTSCLDSAARSLTIRKKQGGSGPLSGPDSLGKRLHYEVAVLVGRGLTKR